MMSHMTGAGQGKGMGQEVSGVGEKGYWLQATGCRQRAKMDITTYRRNRNVLRAKGAELTGAKGEGKLVTSNPSL